MRRIDSDQSVSLSEIGYKSQVFNCTAAEATASHSSPVSPPPYMVGMVEIELDKETGLVTVLDYMAVVDCGIPINPALARIQTEGGIVQGIGHTLMENVQYDTNGKPVESSFLQYKIPTRLDMGHLRVEFENSYEPTGPFGAKSIGGNCHQHSCSGFDPCHLPGHRRLAPGDPHHPGTDCHVHGAKRGAVNSPAAGFPFCFRYSIGPETRLAFPGRFCYIRAANQCFRSAISRYR